MRRPSYGDAIATLALFIALGGSSYAAVTITGAQIKNNSLTSADIKNESLSGRDFADGSIDTEDFDELPRGARGLPGATGATGARGPAGPPGAAGADGKNGTDGAAGKDGVDGKQDGPAGGDLAGAFPNPTIKPGAIDAAKLAEGSVNSAAIKDGTILPTDFADPILRRTDLQEHASDLVNPFELGDEFIDINEITTDPATVKSGVMLDATIAYQNTGDDPAILEIRHIRDGTIKPTVYREAIGAGAFGAAAISFRCNGSMPGEQANVRLQARLVPETAGAVAGTVTFSSLHLATAPIDPLD